jgi:hypothetical protein
MATPIDSSSRSMTSPSRLLASLRNRLFDLGETRVQGAPAIVHPMPALELELVGEASNLIPRGGL